MDIACNNNHAIPGVNPHLPAEDHPPWTSRTRYKTIWLQMLDFLHDSWFLEITAFVAAATLFGTEILILYHFDRKRVDSWPPVWSLNSAIAFMNTLIESLLYFTTTSAIGQMKWLWFRSRRSELIWIDSLARSSTPIGALSILLLHKKTWTNVCRTPVWLGASCVLALLGTAFFSQNVIARKFVDEVYPSDSTYVMVTQRYEDFSQGSSGSTLGDQGLTAPMVSYGTTGFAFASNLLSSASFSRDDLSLNDLYYCDDDGDTAANCSFGLHTTLNICSRCVDISDEINTESGRFDLRHDTLSLDVEHGQVNITSDTAYPDQGQLNASEIGPLIVHYLGLVHDPNFAAKPPVAKECVAYWCATTFDARSSNDNYTVKPGNDGADWQDTVLDRNADTTSNYSISGRTRLGQDQEIYIRSDSCYVNDSKIVDKYDCTFSVSAEAHLGLQNFLSEGYWGNPPLLTGSVERTNASDDAWRTTSFAALAISYACSGQDDGTACTIHLNASLSSSFTNMTAFMSNMVRKTANASGWQWSNGTTYQTVQVFKIRWPWIAYPATVLLLVCTFVAITIYQSRKMQPWKTSILPALFHSIRDIDQAELTDMMRPAAMRNKAEALFAELKDLEDMEKKTERMRWHITM